MEVTGFNSEVKKQVYKVASLSSCSNISGQILMSLVMNPPMVSKSISLRWSEYTDLTYHILFVHLYTIISHPFQVEDDSYPSYQAERNGILSTFSRCAEVILVYFQFSRLTSDFTIEHQLKSNNNICILCFAADV